MLGGDPYRLDLGRDLTPRRDVFREPNSADSMPRKAKFGRCITCEEKAINGAPCGCVSLFLARQGATQALKNGGESWWHSLRGPVWCQRSAEVGCLTEHVPFKGHILADVKCFLLASPASNYSHSSLAILRKLLELPRLDSSAAPNHHQAKKVDGSALLLYPGRKVVVLLVQALRGRIKEPNRFRSVMAPMVRAWTSSAKIRS